MKIDSIKVPYRTGTVAFSVPFNKKDTYFSFSGRSTNQGLYIDNLTIPNTQSMVIGGKKMGFFKSQFRIDVVNSNPYITTPSIGSYTHSERVKRFGIGFSQGTESGQVA